MPMFYTSSEDDEPSIQLYQASESDNHEHGTFNFEPFQSALNWAEHELYANSNQNSNQTNHHPLVDTIQHGSNQDREYDHNLRISSIVFKNQAQPHQSPEKSSQVYRICIDQDLSLQMVALTLQIYYDKQQHGRSRQYNHENKEVVQFNIIPPPPTGLLPSLPPETKIDKSSLYHTHNEIKFQHFQVYEFRGLDQRQELFQRYLENNQFSKL